MSRRRAPRSGAPAPPPRLATAVLLASLHAADRDAVLGDMQEEFAALAMGHGARAARRWYWRQTIVSLGPNLRRRLTHQPSAPVPDRGGLMESIVQDVRYGLRAACRTPLLMTVALLSLAVGISLAAVVFSLLDAAVLRPLPVADPDRLAVVLSIRPDGTNHNFSYPDYADWRAGQRAFTDMTAFSREEVTVRHGSGSQVVAAELVTGNYFTVLGVRTLYGRPIEENDDRADAAPVAVVSEAFWRQIAPGEPFSARTVMLNTREFSIVGVAARPFRGMQIGGDVRVWVPLHAQARLTGVDSSLARRTTSFLTVMGRLRPGSARDAAAGDLNAVESSVARAAGRRTPIVLTVVPGRQGDSMLPEASAAPLTLLLGAAVLVLIVACVNVTNLLLARASGRSREIAVRVALGAARSRVARLVFVEALMLGVAGSLAGLLAARWLSGRAVPFMASFGGPVTLDVGLDWRVTAFVAALGLTATVLAGIAPVLSVFRTSPAASLGEGSRTSSAGPAGTRTRRGLVVAQFALSLALVVCAGLLGRTVYNLRTLATGFDIEHVALLGAEPGAAQYDARKSLAYFTEAETRLRQVPGVRSAGTARVIPLGFGGSRTTIIVPGYQPAPGEDMEINFNRVSPGYFDAMGIALSRGRAFDERDSADRPLVAIVNETMATRYWNGNATGQRMKLGRDEPDIEIVGVVPDVKYRMIREEANASFYVPLAQMPARGGVLHVRTHGNPRDLLDALRRTVAAVDAAVPVTRVRTLRSQADLNLNDERMAMSIALTLGGAALLLAAVGLYGSMAYVVGQRTREMGVRLALGATGGDIRRLVLGQGLRLSLLGTIGGAGLAILMARTIENRLFGVKSADAATILAAAGVLAAVALLASWVPARRAARVDPVAALRQD